jgi:hypothetical protein
LVRQTNAVKRSTPLAAAAQVFPLVRFAVGGMAMCSKNPLRVGEEVPLSRGELRGEWKEVVAFRGE